MFQKLDDTRFNLIVIGQPSPPVAAPELGDSLRIHAIPQDPVNNAELRRVEIPGRSFYLLRPDRHVGLCGVDLEPATIARYLSERLRVVR